MKKKAAVRAFISAAVLLLLLVLVLIFLTLRQGVRYNRILSEYRASQLSSRLTDLYLSGETLNTGDMEAQAIGFGVYDTSGTPILRLGEVPEHIGEIHPSLMGETILREGEFITVLRTSGRGRQRPERGTGPAPRDRIATILVYRDNQARRTLSLMILLTGIVLSAFAVLTVGIAFLYRKINRIKAEEGNNLHLIRLGRAARVLTHEIKNPLGSIRIQTEVLKKKLPGEFGPSLDIIGEETARISRLTDRVGDFLRNPEGHPQKTDLRAVIGEVTPSLSDAIETKTGMEAAYVYIDPDNLKSILSNIIGNALQSGGTAAGVSVALGRKGHGFILTVSDHGPGIDPSDADKIFDLFYTTKTTGSGIGLAVARAFTEAAGGTITAANGPGGGAVLTIYLPEYAEQ